MKKILFICTQNASRSQMAEGFLRALKGDRYEAFSAGTEPRGVNHVCRIIPGVDTKYPGLLCPLTLYLTNKPIKTDQSPVV